MIVTFQSVSGSPGVSVWSVLTLGLWPSEARFDRLAVEADMAGGVMSARYQLEAHTEVLFAEAGHWERGSRLDLSAFASRVADSAWLVPGPKTPESARRLWRTESAAASIAAVAAVDRRVWLFDVGRAMPGSSLDPIMSEAAVAVLFTRGYAEELAKTQRRVRSLKETGAHVIVAVTGSLSHSQEEVTEFLGVGSVSFLPLDERLVEDSREVWQSRRSRRRSVWSAGSTFAGEIADVLAYSPRGVMRVSAEVG